MNLNGRVPYLIFLVTFESKSQFATFVEVSSTGYERFRYFTQKNSERLLKFFNPEENSYLNPKPSHKLNRKPDPYSNALANETLNLNWTT